MPRPAKPASLRCMFTLKQLRYFVAVAEQGSVSAAARVLSISQSSVTEAVKELELDLGVELFDRRAKGMVITHHGQRFLRHASEILGDVSRARQALDAKTEQRVAGRLNIGVTALVAAYAFADVLARYRRAFPEVTVTAIEDDAAYLEHLLIGGELDVAMMIVSGLTNRAALQTEITDISPYRLWLPAGHRLAAKPSIEVGDIAKSRLILLNRDEVINVAEGLFAGSAAAPDVVFRTRSVEAVRSLVGTGAALAILPDIIHRGWSLDGDQIVSRDIAATLPVAQTGLAWRRGSSLSREALEFVALARVRRRG